MRQKISFLALILLIISAVDSNRNLPASALFGSSLVFFFLFSALFFLFPSTLVAAELSAAFPEEGGIYHWIRAAFGENIGMLAIWLQWINTLVWYPTILSFIAGTSAYLFDPALMESKLYMVFAISGIFWALTLINLRGIHVSARFNSLFSSLGTVIPMLLLIALGIFWLASGHPSEISLSPKIIFSELATLNTWTALQAVMGSFVGMELVGVHVTSISFPQKNFPKAILFSSFYILATMLFGSLVIAVVLPAAKINLAGGLMQVFDNFFSVFGLNQLVPLMTLLIVCGSIGGIVNWLISPAKGLLHASRHNFLPPFFRRLNDRGAPSTILISQALLVTFFCSVLLFLPTVNAFYWFLTALSNSLYMAMYIIMFLAIFQIRRKKHVGAFQIPWGKVGLWLVSSFGLIGSILTILFGFVPPEKVNIGSPLRYTLMIAAGNLLLISPVFLCIAYKRRALRRS